jgi:hypothetical protein
MVRAKEETASRCVRGVNTRLVHQAVPLMIVFCRERSFALHSRTVPSRPAVAYLSPAVHPKMRERRGRERIGMR